MINMADAKSSIKSYFFLKIYKKDPVSEIRGIRERKKKVPFKQLSAIDYHDKLMLDLLQNIF